MTTGTVEPSLLEAINRFSRALRASAHRFDRLETGLKRSESAMLRHLERYPESRSSDVAAEYGLDASVVSRQMACLIERGYVERRPDPADARASLLAATALGRERLAEFDSLYSHYLAERFDDWSDERIQHAASVLAEVADKMLHDHDPGVPASDGKDS